MKSPIRSIVVSLALMSSVSASADARSALLSQLLSPTVRLSYAMAPEIRILLDKMAGEALALTPNRPEQWSAQAEILLERFSKGPSGAALDNVSAHMRRFTRRMNEELPPESKLLGGPAREIGMKDILTVQRLAAQELALRKLTWAEQTAQALAPKIEFASDAPKDGPFTTFYKARRNFLLRSKIEK